MHRSLLWQKVGCFLLDFCFIILAFSLAFYFRLGSFIRSDFPFSAYLQNALLTAPLWLLLLVWGGRYELGEKPIGATLRTVSLAALSGTMLFVLIFFFRQQVFFSRLIILYIFLFGTVLGMVSFFLEQEWMRWRTRQRKDILRVLVIGANRTAIELITALQKTDSRHVPVAILAPFGGSAKTICDVPILGKLDALERVVEKEQISEILLCDAPEQILNLLSFAEGHFLGLRIAPEMLGVFRENILPEVLAGKNLLTLKSSPLLGWGQFWKRLFDLVLGAILFPLLGIFWFFQKIARPGKPLFRSEERIGAGGHIFRLWRSARTGQGWGKDWPNVWNILRGEMSFVGPRPARPEEWLHLPNHFRRRLMIKPGLLGPWQVAKLGGAENDFATMCRVDIGYLLNWSFWEDVKILGRSIAAVFRGAK